VSVVEDGCQHSTGNEQAVEPPDKQEGRSWESSARKQVNIRQHQLLQKPHRPH
jgi:hypothetical protein